MGFVLVRESRNHRAYRLCKVKKKKKKRKESKFHPPSCTSNGLLVVTFLFMQFEMVRWKNRSIVAGLLFLPSGC